MTKAERWAYDYLTHPEEVVKKYDLKVEWGDSTLAGMFEKFAEEMPTHNLCPECEDRKLQAKIKLELMQELMQAEIKYAAEHPPFSPPFHDEGNATNHTIDKCGPRCQEHPENADVAQRPEQGFCKPQVGGSNPSVGSTCGHIGYDTMTGICYRCALQGLPTTPRERRHAFRFSDIIRMTNKIFSRESKTEVGTPNPASPATPAAPATSADLGCHSKDDDLWGV